MPINIDTTKPITAIMVRDAMVDCFISAHSKELEDIKSYVKISDEEFERMKRMDVEALIKKIFEDTGGNFDSPTKESLMKALNALAEFAKNFRDQKTVAENYGGMKKLVDLL